MKNKFLPILTLAFCAFGFVSVQAQTAVDYMQTFSTEYKAIQNDTWAYTSSVSHGKSARKVDKRRVELITTTKNALSKAKSSKGFNSNTEYRDAVIEYFQISYDVLNEDYAKIVDMEEISEQSYDNMEAYMTAREQANEKLNEAGKMVQTAQKKFADDNNVNLIAADDDTDKKMEIASQVYKHYNEVYLIFFKSFKQEAYLIDAISRQDLNAIEQNREALKTTAQEGIAKLKAVKAYGDDRSMIENTISLLEFYVQEATIDIPKLTDYYLKSENFQKVKSNFDQIKEKSRTQKDVDTFNAAVNDMNAASKTFNATNESLNTQRGKYIDAWNRTAQKFTDKHTPKL